MCIEINDFFLGALASLIGSFVLVIFLFAFGKPKFKISREIAYLNTNEFGDDLKGSYLIKVTNRSFFISYDIKANIEKLIAYHVNNGTNDRSFDLELVDPTTNLDRKSTRLNSSHVKISYAVF